MSIFVGPGLVPDPTVAPVNSVPRATGPDSLAASSLTITAAGVALFTVPDNTASVLRVLEGANQYLGITTSNGAEAMAYGYAQTTHSFAVRDNVGTAFQILQAGNNQLLVNTTNFSEDITFGNATTNPDYLFNGTGILTVGGSGGAGRVNATFFGPGAFDAAHAINIADLSTSNGVNIGNVTSNPNTAFLGTGTITFGASQARIFGADGDTVLGAVAMSGTERLRVVGDARVEGKLTVTGSIDPTDVQLSGGTALFFASADGITAPVAPAGTGRLRYNDTTKAWQASVDGGAYAALGGAATDIPIADNTVNALLVHEGAQAYIAVTTTNGAETIGLGNATTNPSVNILGSSAVRLTVGGAGAGELDVTQIRPNPGGGGHEIGIASVGINVVVKIGQTGSNTTVNGALNVGNPTSTVTGEIRSQADIIAGGNIDKPGATTLNLGTGNASGVVLSKSAALTDVKGQLTVRQAFTSEGPFLAGGNLDTFDVITGGIANAFTVGGGLGADYININDTGGSQALTLGLPTGTGSCPVRVRGGNAGAVFELAQRTADPTTPANHGTLYAKDVTGTTQLFFGRDDGTFVQLT